MRRLHFPRNAMTLVLMMMVMIVDVKSFTDTELMVNCSSTIYPDTSCSIPPNTITLDLSHEGCIKAYVHCSMEITEAPSSVQSSMFCRRTGISEQPSFRIAYQIFALLLTYLPALTYLDLDNVSEVVQLAPFHNLSKTFAKVISIRG